MIDVIIEANSRPPCCGPLLVSYTAGGVFLALQNKGFEARYIDFMSDMKGQTPKEGQADICCYAVFFGNKINAFRHIEKARAAKKSPQLIIAFGSFASSFPEEMLTRGLADIVVSHDPEFVIPAILQAPQETASWKKIPNISFLEDGKVIHTPKHSNHDLDQIPFISPYFHKQGFQPAFIMTARGCQYHCVYCDRNVLWGGKVRNRSVENVLQEIRELVEVHKVKNIQFLDEDIAADHKRLAALCEGLRKIKGEFYWSCSACINSVSQKTLLLMGRSHCREIYFGVESASPEVLRRIGKVYSRQEILDAVRWSQEAGLRVEVLITVGNPGETDLDKKMTLSVLEELGSEVAVTTNRLVILPGTAFYRKGLKEGWYTPKSFFEDEGIIFYNEKELV